MFRFEICRKLVLILSVRILQALGGEISTCNDIKYLNPSGETRSNVGSGEYKSAGTQAQSFPETRNPNVKANFFLTTRHSSAKVCGVFLFNNIIIIYRKSS